MEPPCKRDKFRKWLSKIKELALMTRMTILDLYVTLSSNLTSKAVMCPSRGTGNDGSDGFRQSLKLHVILVFQRDPNVRNEK